MNKYHQNYHTEHGKWCGPICPFDSDARVMRLTVALLDIVGKGNNRPAKWSIETAQKALEFEKKVAALSQEE